ncbi:MAG: hypothetical protein RLZ44_1593 [Pseudomonadota bacterium]|jgi:hypothetical protein
MSKRARITLESEPQTTIEQEAEQVAARQAPSPEPAGLGAAVAGLAGRLNTATVLKAALVGVAVVAAVLLWKNRRP